MIYMILVACCASTYLIGYMIGYEKGRRAEHKRVAYQSVISKR